MWLRETEHGLEVNIEGVMDEIERRRTNAHKKFKKTKETDATVNVSENNDEIILKAGGRYFKMITVKESSNIEDLLKEEYERQLKAEKDKLLAECKATVDEFKQYAEHTLNESQAEIARLQENLRNSVSMPEVNFAHARAGLSVVKGDRGNLIWLFRTVYNPITFDGEPLDQTIVKKMICPMIIMITTRGDDVVGVETKTMTLDTFRHYHRHGSATNRAVGSDCWGAWKYSGRKWKTADDILGYAREAANVLSNINGHSLASHNPKGLPRIDTVRQHVIRRRGVSETPVVTPDLVLNPRQEREELGIIAEQRGGWRTRQI